MRILYAIQFYENLLLHLMAYDDTKKNHKNWTIKYKYDNNEKIPITC